MASCISRDSQRAFPCAAAWRMQGVCLAVRTPQQAAQDSGLFSGKASRKGRAACSCCVCPAAAVCVQPRVPELWGLQSDAVLQGADSCSSTLLHWNPGDRAHGVLEEGADARWAP